MESEKKKSFFDLDEKEIEELEKKAVFHMKCWKERYRDAYIAFHYPMQGRHKEGFFKTAVLSNYPNKIVWTQTVTQETPTWCYDQL